MLSVEVEDLLCLLWSNLLSLCLWSGIDEANMVCFSTDIKQFIPVEKRWPKAFKILGNLTLTENWSVWHLSTFQLEILKNSQL